MLKSMHAIVLAAGRGSRLGSLTAKQPKCCVTFNGISLIERISESFNSLEVPFTVVAGYMSEALEKKFNTLQNHAWETSGIVQSLMRADAVLSNKTCIISYSDIFYDKRLVCALAASDADICVAVDINSVALWSLRFEDPFQDLECLKIFDDKWIAKIGGRPTSVFDVMGQYMGLIKCTPAGWAQLTSVLDSLKCATQFIDITSLLSLAIESGVKVGCVFNNLPWGEVDHPSDLQLYERIYPEL